MRELQLARKEFKDSNPGFTTPLWKKLGDEAVEALSASYQYFRHPTPENKHHLGEELSDMVFIILDMASKVGIDLNQAMSDKLARDRKRFPPGTVMKHTDYRRRKIALGER